MSTDVYTTAPAGATTIGDGTTLRSRATRRWRSARWTALVLATLVLVVLALALTRPLTSNTPYAPDNPGDRGARAVAEVLAGQGVKVEHVTRVADALRAAGPGTTLLVTPAPFLLSDQAEALAGAEADVVLVGADGFLLDATADGVLRREPQLAAPGDQVPPGCDVPAATASGPSRLVPGISAPGGDATLCWTDGAGNAVLGQVRQEVEASSGTRVRTVTAVDDPAFLTNEAVLDDGNAALALHLLGAHERLVWLVQDPFDVTSSPDQGGTGGALLPPWAGAVGLWALLVGLVAIAWRARRLGRLVHENLPVVVRAAETTRGRGRLYRRSRSRGHAAAGLRAATADRLARRLGLPRSADATAVTDAVVRATGRPTLEVAGLLYGPPPADDSALTALARRLDTLESEVYRS